MNPRWAIALGFSTLAGLYISGAGTQAAGGGARVMPVVDAATLAAGERAFAQCKGCHTITADGHDGVGPNLYGVYGKAAGSNSATYHYSAALKASGLTWNDDGLDTFLAGPSKAVPGTKMPYRGLSDETARKALIAYIRVTSTAH